MTELAEQQIPKPSIVRWITERFRGKPSLTPEPPPPIFPQPEPVRKPVVPPASPVTEAPKIPRAQRRATKHAEYERWKSAARQSEPDNTPLQARIEPAAVSRLAVTEIRPKPADLPSGIKERVVFNQQLLLTRDQIPWLEQKDIRIPLELITVEGTSGERYLYADFIHGRSLVDAARQLIDNRGNIDDLFFSHMPSFLKYGRHPYIKMIHEPKTEKPIYCVYNNDGPRVYFMRYDRLQDIPVIVRIAACDKERQIQVLTTISNWSRKR